MKSDREYDREDQAQAHLREADAVPHRWLAEAMLIDRLPARPLRVLDLGCGDGRLLERVLAARPESTGLAVDVSPAMLKRAAARFRDIPAVQVIAHDLTQPLPESWGHFDAVVSSFAIHHLEHPRKRELYVEAFELLNPGGVLCNLEHVASPTDRLHKRFLETMKMPEDETNILLDAEAQLRWLREIGFADVDCDWKWLELALLAGVKASSVLSRQKHKAL